MNEIERQKRDSDNPQELYKYCFDQIMDISRLVKKDKPIQRSFDNVDELLHVNSGGEGCTFIFVTTQLNISKPDIPEGAYDNEFIFAFSSDKMSLQYFEAFPRRTQSITIDISDYQDVNALINNMYPFIEKFNLLLEYFHLQNRVEIPS